MLIAHVVYIFIPYKNILFYTLAFISRYTFLIFSYLLVVGFNKTKNIKKYMIRMLIFAFISQPFFNYFINGDYLITTSLNIMFTMFITLIFLHIYKTEKDPFIKFFLLLSLYMLSLFCDWGIIFIPITFIFYIFENKSLKYTNILICLLLLIYMVFQKHKIIYLGFFIQLSLINILDVNKKNNYSLKYFFYLFYPIHMFLLRLIYVVFN